MDKIEINKITQDRLWQHLKEQSPVPILSGEDYRNRKEIWSNIESEVNEGRYHTRPIHGFLSAPKSNGIPRFIPILSMYENTVYWACVKTFDKELANLAIPDTFGGWSMGSERRTKEEANAREIYDEQASFKYDEMGDFIEYIPVSAYDRTKWFENWQNFWKILAAKFENAQNDSYFVCFDIANFYDSIDLTHLERRLRSVVNGNLAIEVLFYFLSTWNKELTTYARATKGLPQDIVGDCSRVLANFYLTSFDAAMREKSTCQHNRLMYVMQMIWCYIARTKKLVNNCCFLRLKNFIL